MRRRDQARLGLSALFRYPAFVRRDARARTLSQPSSVVRIGGRPSRAEASLLASWHRAKAPKCQMRRSLQMSRAMSADMRSARLVGQP